MPSPRPGHPLTVSVRFQRTLGFLQRPRSSSRRSVSRPGLSVCSAWLVLNISPIQTSDPKIAYMVFHCPFSSHRAPAARWLEKGRGRRLAVGAEDVAAGMHRVAFLCAFEPVFARNAHHEYACPTWWRPCPCPPTTCRCSVAEDHPPTALTRRRSSRQTPFPWHPTFFSTRVRVWSGRVSSFSSNISVSLWIIVLSWHFYFLVGCNKMNSNSLRSDDLCPS